MAMDSRDDGGAYEVGYGKPPKSTRFKKGQSGNPKGRKPRARNVSVVLANELDLVVTIRDGDREKKISKREALIKSLVNDAIKGQPMARKTLISLLNVEPPQEPFVADQNDDLMLDEFLKSAQHHIERTPAEPEENEDGWTR